MPLATGLSAQVFVAIFVIYALNYAYFFIDDEAIRFVYAQNVVDGHGLVYNPTDGPAEGYSDFLTVWIDVVIIELVTLVGASKLWALAIAEIFAFLCAIALVIFTYAILKKSSDPDRVPLIAGMMFLVLAGPLAVWSSSGLETTLFALIAAVLVAALLDVEQGDARNDRVILVSVVLLFLCRIDGFVWAGALIAPFLVFMTPARRRGFIKRVVLPTLAVFIAYHAWRVWYFGELLSLPVYAKVMYKLLARHETLVSNDPPHNYVIAFLNAYHWIPAGVLVSGFAATYSRSRAMRSLAVGTGLVWCYLGVVGDWMFGFRFFVPLLAAMAILAAAGFAALRRWRPRTALAALIVWAQGRFEWGPRALGHRSILADPRRADAKNIVNVKIKFREPYRPFAPSVPVEHAATFFDLCDPARHLPARFMLLVAPVRPAMRETIPAVTHVDGTARLQTVTSDVNGRYYRLLSRFGEATGVPILLNTSFNLRGEPIVNTPQEVFSTFDRSGMDALVLDRTIILKGDS